MKPIAIIALVASGLMLTACAGASAPSDKSACEAYAKVLSDWAVSGGTGELAADGVAIKMRTEVAPLATEDLAESIGLVADLMEAGDPELATDAQTSAGVDVKERCEAAGVAW